MPDNSTCAELGLERAIELEYDEQRREFVAENGTRLGENHYRFEINGEQYAVNLTEVTVADGEPVSFNWTSSLRMAAVIVTGGPDANVYSFDGALGRAELRAPINENAGQNYAIGNVSFCYDPGTPNAVENAGLEGRDPAAPIDALGAFVALLAGAVLVHRRD